MLKFLENSTRNRTILKESRYLIQIVLTQKCNLKCVYCWQDHEEKEIFQYDKVMSTLFQTLRSFNGSKRLSIHFFGGEPLIAFDTLKKITSEVNALWETEGWPKENLIFEIMTNGVLLNKKVRDWLAQNPNVFPCMSMDGTPEMQNRNRSNSFNRIKRKIPFVKKYKTPVKMTISQYTMRGLAEGVKYIHSLGMECDATIVMEDVWGGEAEKNSLLKIFDKELSELISFYLENPGIPRSTILPLLTIPLPQSKVSFASSGCGMGVGLISINPDGKTYPCQRATVHYQNENLPEPQIERTSFKPDECAACKLLPMCPECKANNYAYNTDTNNKTTFHCEFFKLQIRASAVLFLKEFEEWYKKGLLIDLDKDNHEFLSQRLNTALFIEEYTSSFYQSLIQRDFQKA